MFSQNNLKYYYPSQINYNPQIPKNNMQMNAENQMNSDSVFSNRNFIPDYSIGNPLNDNFSCYSSTSTNTGISQMSSIYLNNQKKKILTDEINQCINKVLENFIPDLCNETAKKIYEALIPSINQNEEEIKNLRNNLDLIKNNFENMTFLTNDYKDMKNLSNFNNQLNIMNNSINNCNVLIENQIEIEKGNNEFYKNQENKINEIKNKNNLIYK